MEIILVPCCDMIYQASYLGESLCFEGSDKFYHYFLLCCHWLSALFVVTVHFNSVHSPSAHMCIVSYMRYSVSKCKQLFKCDDIHHKMISISISPSSYETKLQACTETHTPIHPPTHPAINTAMSPGPKPKHSSILYGQRV